MDESAGDSYLLKPARQLTLKLNDLAGAFHLPAFLNLQAGKVKNEKGSSVNGWAKYRPAQQGQ